MIVYNRRELYKHSDKRSLVPTARAYRDLSGITIKKTRVACSGYFMYFLYDSSIPRFMYKYNAS